ncbi:uncharacterized protein [Littorina saxatilis]
MNEEPWEGPGHCVRSECNGTKGRNQKPDKMSDYKNTRYNYTQLLKTESDFNNLLHILQDSRRQDTYIPRNNLKYVVVEAFDGMKQALLEALDSSIWSSSEDSNNNSHNARLRDILLDDLTTLRPCQEPSTELSTQPSTQPATRQRRRRWLPSLRRTSRGFSFEPADVSGASFDTVTLTDDELDAEVIFVTPSTQSDFSDEPISDVDTTGPRPTREEVAFQGKVLSMLSRMSQRLTGFFQWLKTKVKKLATKAWTKVCDTFKAMFTFLKNACQRLRGTCCRPATRLHPY